MLRFRLIACVFSLCVLCLSVAGTAFAAEPSVTEQETQEMKAQLDGRIQAMLDAPDGTPFDLEYTEDGTLSRLKIKGSMEVPTSMSGARADRMAMESAVRKARAGFSTFLNSEVIFVESGNEMINIVAKDGAETSEYTQASASSINVASQSFQRGLITILQHFEGEGDRRTCTVILGWSQKLVNASMQAQGAMKRNPDAAGSSQPKAEQQQQGGSDTKTRVGDMDF
ncbi:MAG: hypothetical protein LBV80_01305 [Deltaproteobacteria bacterium]|jgi:hypothetical protein|nr:hypothetical protein [Deltaproteobacteria bacterium]